MVHSGQGRDQVDAAVVPDVRGERRAVAGLYDLIAGTTATLLVSRRREEHMRRRLLLCGAILVLGCCSGPSSARPSGDMINMFTTVMRQAIVDNVRREWAKIPQSQIACLDEALWSQGASVGGLVNSGISPADPRISTLRRSCSASAAGSTSLTPLVVQGEMPNNLPFVVDGLALGSRVNLGSTAYRSYQCSPSEQYEGLTWCNWRRGAPANRKHYPHQQFTTRHGRNRALHQPICRTGDP